MTRPERENTVWLDADLARLKDGAPISDAFLAQLTQESIAAQPQPHLQIAAQSRWQNVLDVLGGWGGLGGLVAATCVGFAVGLGGSDMLDTTLDGYTTLGLTGTIGATTDVIAFGWDLEDG